ncbi:serine/threonine protein kinase [Streptomyces sp. NPDC057381]|uniref:serine/threonine protein kinase n=1 Tax=Streptomyces sp. NPDC057381 TaxID=3346111 RepID=UPI00362C3D01
MSKNRTYVRGATAMALALGGTIALAGTANAATPQSVCGSGYTVRASHAIGEGPNARVYLLRDGNRACVVNFKTGGSVGNSVGIGAWVQGLGGSRSADEGAYKYYAGPVKVTSSCVNWGGNYGPEYRWSNSPC